MAPKGRFAPTPSGRMHLGNLLSALLAWLDARSGGGALVLRIEDLDTQRTSPPSSPSSPSPRRSSMTWLPGGARAGAWASLRSTSASRTWTPSGPARLHAEPPHGLL